MDETTLKVESEVMVVTVSELVSTVHIRSIESTLNSNVVKLESKPMKTRKVSIKVVAEENETIKVSKKVVFIVDDKFVCLTMKRTGANRQSKQKIPSILRCVSTFPKESSISPRISSKKSPSGSLLIQPMMSLLKSRSMSPLMKSSMRPIKSPVKSPVSPKMITESTVSPRISSMKSPTGSPKISPLMSRMKSGSKSPRMKSSIRPTKSPVKSPVSPRMSTVSTVSPQMSPYLSLPGYQPISAINR